MAWHRSTHVRLKLSKWRRSYFLQVDHRNSEVGIIEGSYFPQHNRNYMIQRNKSGWKYKDHNHSYGRGAARITQRALLIPPQHGAENTNRGKSDKKGTAGILRSTTTVHCKEALQRILMPQHRIKLHEAKGTNHGEGHKPYISEGEATGMLRSWTQDPATEWGNTANGPHHVQRFKFNNQSKEASPGSPNPRHRIKLHAAKGTIHGGKRQPYIWKGDLRNAEVVDPGPSRRVRENITKSPHHLQRFKRNFARKTTAILRCSAYKSAMKTREHQQWPPLTPYL